MTLSASFAYGYPKRNNKAPTLLEAMKEAIGKMGGPPKTLFTDDEGGMNNNAVMTYLDEHHIRHIITRAHAGIAERTIRTIKAMIYARIESAKERGNENKRWIDVLYPVMLTYNHQDKHSATKTTPNDARKPQNQLQTKINLAETGSS